MAKRIILVRDEASPRCGQFLEPLAPVFCLFYIVQARGLIMIHTKAKSLGANALERSLKKGKRKDGFMI